MSTGAMRQAMNENVPTGRAIPPHPFVGILPPELWNLTKIPFFQPFQVLGLAAGATGVATVKADPGFALVAYFANVSLRSADNVTDRTGHPVTVSISDPSGRTYNPAQMPNDIRNIMGTAAQPSILPLPIIIMPGASLDLAFTNLHPADVLNIRGTLMGFQAAITNR